MWGGTRPFLYLLPLTKPELSVIGTFAWKLSVTL